MINHASLTRAILTTKSVNVERCRAMGRARRGPYDPATCAKVSEALRRLGTMDFAIRREHVFAKRARWLVNVLVTQGDRRVFRLRCAGDDGNMVDLETSIGIDEHPIELLLKLMRMPTAPAVLRLDCENHRAVSSQAAAAGRDGDGRARTTAGTTARAQARVHAQALSRATIRQRRRKPYG
jgi:hypothetical protein